jgi:hypothetical protein
MLAWIRGPEGMKRGKRKTSTESTFTGRLLDIFEEKLANLPEEEQDKRLAAFHKKATKVYRESRTITSQPSQTPASPLAARSHE